jgi:hypothetical protein
MRPFSYSTQSSSLLATTGANQSFKRTAAPPLNSSVSPHSIPDQQRDFSNMKNRYSVTFFVLTLFILFAATSQSAFAGVYTDDLSKCLVSKTTPDQKAVLVNWMFSAMSLNPSVAKFVSIPDTKRKEFNVNMANLFESLMTVTCKQEMRLAVKYEGNGAVEAGFNVLGQVAGRELFSNPEVAKGMSELDKYIDKGKLKAAMSSDK